MFLQKVKDMLLHTSVIIMMMYSARTCHQTVNTQNTVLIITPARYDLL